MKLKSFHDLPSLAKPISTPVVVLTKRDWVKGIAAGIKSIRPGRELVAGGDVIWKPINKQAALLLSKSDPIYKPNYFKNMKMTNIEKVETPEGTTTVGRCLPYGIKDKNSDELLKIDMGHKLKKIASGQPQSGLEFAEEVRHARKILDDATDLFRTEVIKFTSEDMPKAVEKVRQWRMTIEREKDMSLRALQDLRKFFLEADHEKEMLRLSEFVRICERLAALAKDGTLDKVAEVMLKLA